MAEGDAGSRSSFEETVRSLQGLRISSVDYWDIHNFESDPARWDYGDWHHAVMGVQLTTDDGPRTVTWTNRFHPYGVEVFSDPIERHLVLGEAGPERVGPEGDGRWAAFIDAPISATATWWDRIELGPATVLGTGEIVDPARAIDVPTALRLDFEAGHVWFVAAMPQLPSSDSVFVGADEIMVVFTDEKMRSIGYRDSAFVP